jgi:tetratricopeptide (TPR) repeat protein
LCNEQLKGQSKNKLDLLKLKGELLIALGKYDEAAAFYREIQVERAIPWAALGLGQAHFNQERYELAKEVFSSLIQDNPAFVAAYDWLAKVLNKEGNLAESQKILLEAAQKSPKAILRQRALAETSFLIGDLDNSESAYKRVMRIGKNSCYKSPGDYTGLARTLVQKDSPADALKVVSSLKQEFSDSQDAGIMAAVMESEIYHKQGNDELSEQALNKALEAYTNQPDSVSSDIALQMAQACFITGKTEEGNTLIKQVVRNNHESEEILARAREIFTRAGLAQEGDDLIAATKREVVELNNRGVELARGGKLEASIELFMTAAKGMPENKTINLNAAQSLIMQMQKNGADKNRLEIAKIYLDRVRNVEAANEKLQRLTATWRQLTSKS